MMLEPGPWNARTGTVPLQPSGIIFMLTNREVGKRLTDTSWYTAREGLFLVFKPFHYDHPSGAVRMGTAQNRNLLILHGHGNLRASFAGRHTGGIFRNT